MDLRVFCERMLLFLSGMHLEVELLGQTITVRLTFRGIVRMLCKAAASFTFLLVVCEDSNFSTSLSILTSLFYYNHSNGCEVVSHCGFDLPFSDD